ncbi:hypothetical protein [Halorussus salinus]|uniref:hypothetical protein n=1 Tax=Halorussus salinus TaxID=1364935 RepID=UPI0010933447|nr:hypothetical protein [Halorussus salinus]
MEKHNVPNSRKKTVSFHAQKKNESSGDVSTEKIYLDPDESSSEMSQTISKVNDTDDYYSFLYLNLDVAGNANLDGPGPDDGLSISYSDVAYRTLPDTVGSSQYVTTGDSDTNQYGAKGRFNDDTLGSRNEAWLELEMDTRSGYSGETTVYGDYIHNWNPGDIPQNLGATYTLKGAGTLAISVTGTVNKYRAESYVYQTV